MARELAAIFCEQQKFQIQGTEHLSTFLTSSILVPGFVPSAHLRQLEIVIRPPYWNLPYWTQEIDMDYDNIASTSIHQLEQLLQVEHCRGL
jgi:hypothetical protein